jgi:hypothetical protein
VNVLHHQEDVGNRIRIYVNGVMKADFADNERVSNYHKYGAYGTLRTAEAVVKWRAVRHFRDGRAPPGNVAIAGTADGVPHPAPSGRNLRILLGEAAGTVDLLSISGRRLSTWRLSGGLEHTLVMPGANGVYLVHIRAAGSGMARKVVLDGSSLRMEKAPAW